ncbi:MAG: MEDS domain-containing protein, partial [Methanomicrobiales archaeon]|nr:MEDS domain-containing protein [Methanomicrobiales archaeon]
LRAGLEHNEKVFYIVDARTKDVVINYLKDDGIDVDYYLKKGQFAVLTIADAYMKDGIFDPDRMIVLLTSETKKALDEGYSALRVTGEMSWALRGLPGSERLIEYENKLNTFFPGSKCLAICQYDRRRFDADILLNILLTHPFAFIGTELYDNFYYTPPEVILQPDQSEMTLDRWIANLVDRKVAEQALRESEEKYRTLFSGMPSGVAVYEAVDDGEDFVFRDFNAVGEAIEHVHKEEVIGRRVTEVFPGVKEFGVFSVFQRVWRTGNPEFFPMAVYRNLRDPGTWRESWVYKLPTGEIVAIYNDVTDRKRAEEELQTHQTELTMQNEELRAIQQDLQVSRDQYMDLYDMAPVGYLTISEKGIVLKANLTSATLLNVERRTLVNAPLSRFIVPEDQNTYYLHRKYLIDTKQKQSFELKIQRQGGSSPIWAHIIMELAQVEEGDAEVSNLIMIDITARKQAEEALRESGQRFIFSLEAADIGAWELDLVTHTAWRSLRHDQIFGYEKLLPEWTYEMFLDHVLPEDRSIVDTKFGQAMKNFLNWDFECRIRRNDGTIRWIWAKGHPEYNDLLEPKKMFGLVQDITERKRVEEALRESEEKYRTLIETTDTGFVFIDQGGLVLDANPEYVRLTGHRDLKEIFGRSVIEWTADYEKEKNAAAVKTCFEKGSIRNLEIDYVDSKGNITPIEINATCIEIGGKTQTKTICRDITTRK